MNPLTNDVDSIPSELRGHVPALDGLRGLAVLLVLVFHIAQSEVAPSGGIARAFYGATRIGQTGVDLFFVLSGFLITGILYDTKASPRYFFNFYGRRTLRIFPLYYGVLIAAFVLTPALFGIGPVGVNPIWLWTYTANLPATFGVEGGTFGHFWTLAIEEQFYLVWPAVIFAFGRRRLMGVCLGCIAGAAAIRVVMEIYGFSSFTFTLARMDSLTLGAWLALAARGPLGMAGWRGKAWVTSIVTAGLAAPIYLANSGSGAAWLQVFKYSLIGVFYGSILVLAVTSRWAAVPFRSAMLRWLGKYSYGLYVFHPLFIMLAARMTMGMLDPGWALASRVGIIVAGSMATAWLSWHLYEKRFLAWKSLFVDTTPTTASDRTRPRMPAQVAVAP
ncbi:acyltransferase [Isosphaeraceae bacterium EP7]